MRDAVLQSKSSTSMEEDPRDSSCYYPGCKKDTNCNCEICLDSINATLDLMPQSIHKSSLTEFSASKPKPNVNVECTPISFDASIMSTPSSNASNMSPSPVTKSSARSDLNQKIEKEEKKGQEQGCFSGVNIILRLIMGLGFLLCVDLAFSWVVSGIFQPSLSPDLVKRVGERCGQVQDLNGKLRFLQKELTTGVVDGKVSNCSYNDSLWKINQDGLLLISRCTLYKSAIEEVTIWGWPLQTAGLLTTGLSSRRYTILSGRVTEWNSGQVSFLIRKANTSWVQPKWGASVVQLDPNTWVLEYQRSPIFDGTRLYSAALLEFLQYRILRLIARVKKDFWLFAAFDDSMYYGLTTACNGRKIPT